MSLTPVTVLIIDKNSNIKTLNVKDLKENELFKKAGFKTDNGFKTHTTWNVNIDGKCYMISLYGKTDGKCNMENKYEFPPPVDKLLFFGSCLLLCSIVSNSNTDSKQYVNLSIELWKQMYEKLFGGFEDISHGKEGKEDSDYDDELLMIKHSNKTKVGGYLKDGFVIDSSDTDEESDSIPDEKYFKHKKKNSFESFDGEILLEPIGSELSEEDYDYSDNDM
jgi:hypothetical protein